MLQILTVCWSCGKEGKIQPASNSGDLSKNKSVLIIFDYLIVEANKTAEKSNN